MIPGLSHWDLVAVEKPARYLGGEWNQARPKPDARLNVCLGFPDVYELGMSNIALKILYGLLDADPQIAVERVFAPWYDFADLLQKKGIPLGGLESGRPLSQFDLIGLTLPYEMTFTNILMMLDLGGIPLTWKERSSGPLVIGGGPSGANPLPVADFFDAILIGDGEEALPELCRLMITAKDGGTGRAELLEQISGLEGFWVPRFPKPVRRRVFKGFGASTPPLKPVISAIESIQDRIPLEIFRGCIQGCRFCNAGFYYRPKRERRPEELLQWAEQLMRSTGDETVGLISLSTSDFTCLGSLIEGLISRNVYPDQSISVPSLRMNDRTLELLKKGSQIKKSGLTFAPEAGSQRLRDIIGKKITEADILNVIEATRESYYQTVKLYFMYGLPFETEGDVEAVGELARKIEETARRNRLRKDLSISLSAFVPKPFTPFQWAAQLPGEELNNRRKTIAQALKRTRAKVSWRDEYLAGLEAVLARGDERVGKLILAAYRRGCRFDGWNEGFRRPFWEEAFRDTGLTLEEFTRGFEPGASLPWDFVDFRVPRAYYLDEWGRAAAIAEKTYETVTEPIPECSRLDRQPKPAVASPGKPVAPPVAPQIETGFRFRLVYRKAGVAIYLAHLDTMHALTRALRRSGLPYRISQGFSPRPVCSFGPALSLGHAGAAEVFDFWLNEAIPIETIVSSLSPVMPPGLTVVHVLSLPEKAKAVPSEAPMRYRLRFASTAEPLLERVVAFLGDPTREITIKRADGERRQPLGTAVTRIERESSPDGLSLILDFARAGSGIPSPSKIIGALVGELGDARDGLLEAERLAVLDERLKE